MNLFMNLKIRNKIILCFFLIVIMMGTVGYVGISNMQTIGKLDNELYTDNTEPITSITVVQVDLQKNRVNIRNMIMEKDIDKNKDNRKLLTETDNEIDKFMNDFKNTIKAQNIMDEYNVLKENIDKYRPVRDKIAEYAMQNKDDEAIALVNGEGSVLAKAIDTSASKLIDLKENQGKSKAETNMKTVSNATISMLVIIIIGIIISTILGFVLSNLISDPVNKVKNILKEISKGHVRDRANISTRDEIGEMARTMDELAENLQTNIVAVMNRIAQGDVSMDLVEIDEKDEITPAMNKMISNIRNLVMDTNTLSKAAKEGKLDERADSSIHSGDFQKIIEGINELIEAMANPIMEVNEVMKEMSKGNLDVSVNGNYKGDFGALANAVNTTTDSLNSVLGEINGAAEQVFSGASQISDGSQALARGATEQASSLEELTASITEIAAQTKENSGNANTAKELALKVKENANDGNEHMSEMLKSMGEINESSANISKIIKVIDEIAFQTNILALNAAVEAARAGQHGKGFAVVAEEVRNLAARSANAAKETTTLIEGSIKKAERGTEIANNTAKALYEIVDGVSKAATLVSEIAASSEEQATGITQINVGIEQVSQVVQTNSATAEESAAASEELSSQSELLKNMVSSFKLKNAIMMSEKGIQAQSYMRKQNYNSISNNKAYTEAANSIQKIRLDLSDNEFGKY
ncbi:methyl-accepting chemotaxis protein [Clostridium saccharoperbutylacetonicum]|uniref:Methyl-accepting chemotaxis protein n=1 Tax=Clostridium saccharoperbutylacetonicum N1-4(HMT) TaxID=931276 RepID=M1MRJ2_9CLOT|nr:methyl-accepting chemotaxis protein [Clostridium saccharoperbutylacetonicum]AGF57371.1 methyl-accepting chemotaxis protein [Clostridium saccharoperbutylacetonicum N1-4(HMT)]NRT61865.1 methyl-accepting chemotaxis protein [Clostridium saccharoperbutylacetonicum]NSB25191.1 methyl-accepting chemotaxis protein [Clostridium saccharoperbutylacetonicum]NSB44563.1 methyl-accepting chemotaxis protein [Clostridium saccharoperbutylacetonicum]